jgi:regulatory protein
VDFEKKKIKLTPTQARKKLEWYCAYQERCHSEVKEKLYNYGLFPNEVDQIVAYLITENFLNEERFAEAYASGKFSMKHWGKIKIKQGLKQRHISDYCIKKALNSIDGDEYFEVLKKVAEKKSKTLKETKGLSKSQKEYQKKMKLISYLMSRGFENDLVSEVVKEVINEK